METRTIRNEPTVSKLFLNQKSDRLDFLKSEKQNSIGNLEIEILASYLGISMSIRLVYTLVDEESGDVGVFLLVFPRCLFDF